MEDITGNGLNYGFFHENVLKKRRKKMLVGHLAFFSVVITLVKVLIKNTERNIIAITDCPSNTDRDGLRVGKTVLHCKILSLRANSLTGTHCLMCTLLT